VLIRMNGLSAGGRYQQTAAQIDALRAAEARLRAERDQLDAIAFPPALAVREGVPSAAQAMANQRALFDSRKRVFDAERGIQNARLDQSAAEASGPERQLRFVREQVAGMRSLYRRGFAPKSTLYDLERLQVELETQAAVNRARAAEAQMTAVREDEARRGEIVEQLRLVQADLQQVGPQMAMARYNAERDLVRAPVAGAVVGLEPFAPGAVLSPGQKVMDLLPDGRALIVEARIRPEDIDDVQVGSRADVRFTTIHPRGPSKVHGVVTTLSADRLTDPATGAAYYLAYIALDASDIRSDDLSLTAGLPASVNIRTSERTALNYIFAPLLDAFSKAGREE
jgi:HlyD family type I secretion membrane fusion protein